MKKDPVSLFTSYCRWASSVSGRSYNGNIPIGCLVFWPRWQLRVPCNIHCERTLSQVLSPRSHSSLHASKSRDGFNIYLSLWVKLLKW